jgi:hypothetical protein
VLLVGPTVYFPEDFDYLNPDEITISGLRLLPWAPIQQRHERSALGMANSKALSAL